MIYLLLFLCSFLFTYLIKNYAIRKSLVDIPNARSSHTIPTPHGGGIAIVLTWFIGLSYLYYINSIDNSLYYALMSGLLLAMVSFLDDIYDLNPKIRLATQLLVALLGLYFLGGLNKIDFVVIIIENKLMINILAVFAIIWFINLYNFLDGIDGYAGSEAVFLAFAGFVFFENEFYLVLAVSVLGFLIWNWHIAKIFMGDVGSTLLGYNIAIFAIYHQNDDHSILIWMILFGLFWFDATLTLIRRFKKHEALSIAHKKHAYQRLTQSGYSHGLVVVLGMIVNLLLFAIVYFISNILIAFLSSIFLLFTVMKIVDKNKKFE